MRNFTKLKYEAPEIKVILVDKDIITESIGENEEFTGIEVPGGE